VLFPIGETTITSATDYTPVFILSGFFFGNSGADLRVRNEVYYSSVNGSAMTLAGTAHFNTDPAVDSATATLNDTIGVSIKMTMQTTDADNEDNDTLLFKLPTGTQFATSTFVTDASSTYFDATVAVDSTLYNFAYPQVYALVSSTATGNTLGTAGTGILTISNITTRIS